MFRRKCSCQNYASQLYDQGTFYRAFLQDVRSCKRQLVIESPYITSRRISIILPIFKQLRERGIQIIVNTREPKEHEGIYKKQAEQAVAQLQALNVVVLYTGRHHRKLAIIDGEIVWEGSLNILSFSDSCEVMRRITSSVEAMKLISFIELDKFVKCLDIYRQNF